MLVYTNRNATIMCVWEKRGRDYNAVDIFGLGQVLRLLACDTNTETLAVWGTKIQLQSNFPYSSNPRNLYGPGERYLFLQTITVAKYQQGEKYSKRNTELHPTTRRRVKIGVSHIRYSRTFRFVFQG
jgi:hypothetical protein